MDVSGLLEQIRLIVQEPTSNLPAASLLLAAVTLVLLIVLVLFLLVLTGRGRAESPQAAARAGRAPKARRATIRPRVDAWSRRRFSLVVGAVVLLALVSAYGVTSTDSYCAATCHAGEPIVAEFADEAHADVACVSCHEEAFPGGIVSSSASRARYVVREAFPFDRREGAVAIPVGRCLACHEDILDETLEDSARGLLVSHAEPIEAGMSCNDCHGEIGHFIDGTSPEMSQCLTCHDGERAASACETCHTSDTSLAAAGDRIFAPVRLLSRDCGGCHAQDTCDDCHGTRMPHDRSFLRRGHARYAAFDLKQTCYRCHPQGDCTACHEPFDTSGHVGNWRIEHQNFPFTSPCGCHQPQGSTESFCEECHDTDPR